MKRKCTGALALLCGLAVALTSCATLISGTHQTVTIDSYPPGALVKLGYQTGTTPVTFSVAKGKHHVVQISQGPEKRVLPLSRKLDPVTLLNIIPPLWPGFIVDAVTGAITKYNPDVIYVDFTVPAHATDAQLAGFRR